MLKRRAVLIISLENGTTLPKLEYGVRVDLTYKKFDLSLFGSGVGGRTGFDVYTFFNNLMKSRDNVGPDVFDGWTPTHTNTNVPALTLKDNNNERSHFRLLHS